MAPTLYCTDASPACRAILMISKALGVDLNIEECNLATGDHLSPDFLKVLKLSDNVIGTENLKQNLLNILA